MMLLRFIAYCFSLQLVVAVAVPDGFEDSLVIPLGHGDAGVTDLSFTPGGELLVATKGGRLYAYDDFENSPSSQRTILDISDIICTNGERGLATVTVHPNFDDKRYVYVCYVYKKNGDGCDNDPITGPVYRLSRFLMPDGGGQLTSEKVLLETPPMEGQIHNSGDIKFGKDGFLYASIGDGFGYQRASSQNTSNLFGTIVRLTDDGRIPPTNPFSTGPRCNLNGETSSGGTCAEIFASGLRNPWRFSMDPNTESNKVRFYVGDVGSSKWEEIDEGGDDFKGANYGFPEREGPCRRGSYTNCDIDPDSGFDEPIHFYPHNEDGEGAVTASAFVPDGVWPSEYENTYLYAEFISGKIFVMRGGGGPGCRDCDPPTSRFETEELTSSEEVVSMEFAPYMNSLALYYVSRRSDVGSSVRRIAYIGNMNRKPQAVITTSTAYGPVELKVEFDGTGSSDPDGNELSYEWDLDGNGSTDSTEPMATFTYKSAGLFVASLTVSDGEGRESTSTIEISVGNKPVPYIDIPPEDATFAVNDVFTLSGRASDESDGLLPDTSLTWEVRQHHGGHWHPFLDATNGNGITIHPAPSPEDINAATNSYLEILLTATDIDGLSATETRNIQPRKVLQKFDSIPTKLNLLLDGHLITTPRTITVWEGQEITIEAEDQFSGSEYFVWNSWSDGGSRAHSITIVPDIGTIPEFVASFTATTPSVLLYQNNILLSGETVESDPPGYFLQQRFNGQLVLHKGSAGASQGVLWLSGYGGGPSGDYFSILQGDGNLITWGGTPSDEENSLKWKSDETGESGRYFLEFDEAQRKIAVFAGTPSSRGESLWNEAVSGIAEKEAFVLLSQSTTLLSGQMTESIPPGYFLQQVPNGRLVLHKGSDGNSLGVLWSSGYGGGPSGEYYTMLQGDGNLITWSGTPADTGMLKWKSDETGESGRYFLEVDEVQQHIAIYAGAPSTRGKILWSEEVSGRAEHRYFLLLSHSTTLVQGKTFESSPPGYFLQQEPNGRLLLHKGSAGNSQGVLWSSGYRGGPIGKYYTILQGDGNLITWGGIPAETGLLKWKSDKTGESGGGYFLEVDAVQLKIAIYAGAPSTRGEMLWSEEILGTAEHQLFLFLSQSTILVQGETFESSPPGYFLRQERNGQLVLYKGSAGNSQGVLWSSGYDDGPPGEYYTKLQGDGNFITWGGTPANTGLLKWKSDETGESGSGYFLELDLIKQMIAIYAGTPSSRGGVLWQEPTSLTEPMTRKYIRG